VRFDWKDDLRPVSAIDAFLKPGTYTVEPDIQGGSVLTVCNTPDATSGRDPAHLTHSRSEGCARP
jgi:hypothetical protein